MIRDKDFGLVSGWQELRLLKDLEKELVHDEFKVSIGEMIKAKENENGNRT
ncbi:hypothetical protein [Liquorilactobacillus nagelii]|uniref:hypothetical protein n=1 Tax=Liquorilactobacillus nagelii TaxID=82688 RepID=UPI00242CE542|nr:hypothetical protein [Liquorilactobacillus nagelii]MCI1700007.1 hypothetical protein [Liquorilactobacillus nagelii]